MPTVFGGGGGGSGGGGMTLVETLTDPGDGQFDFDNIPSTGNRIIVLGEIRSTETSPADGLVVFFNADGTQTNYDRQNNVGNNGTDSNVESNGSIIGSCPGASATAGSHCQFKLTMENYAGSSLQNAYARISFRLVSANITVGQVSVVHRTATAALTRLRILSDNFGTDDLTGTLRLYIQD